MANIKFISGDGVEHEVEETSPAADHMRTSGFQRIGDAKPETSGGEAAKPNLAKMKKAELVAYAESIGVTVVPDGMTNKAIIAAIEAAQA